MPALRVAVLRVRGPHAKPEDAWAWLYHDWLPGSGEEPADHPPVEDYPNDCRSLPPAERLTEIILPLEAREQGEAREEVSSLAPPHVSGSRRLPRGGT
ncbi:GyrI-like domain-containing protein [Dankookia sp. GCM10030260]|uniref:GyrI-like domain-containing protein n=1 Tax=Dankookia sp. GCM10030260 TaxID=3273390 RepID=UPI003610CD5C